MGSEPAGDRRHDLTSHPRCPTGTHRRRLLLRQRAPLPSRLAGTREILSGCRNDVGASLLFPLAKEIEAELELERHGVEFIALPIMATNLNSKASPPAIF